MSKTLLRGNRRMGYLLVGLAVVGIVVTTTASWLPTTWRFPIMLTSGLATAALAMGAWLCLRPRLGLDRRGLFVHLRPGSPLCVPLEAVEVFFIGQGAVQGNEPGQPDGYQGAVAANVIVRISESATEWHQRDVPLVFGVWRDGYITVRGLWCENINAGVLKRMNHELMEFKRQHRKQAAR